MGKARLGDAIGRNPTDKSKPGTKRSILVRYVKKARNYLVWVQLACARYGIAVIIV